MTTISVGPVRLELVPALGGGISRLDVKGVPVLRPWKGDADNLFSLASNILVPFSNRVSGGGFDWNGKHHLLEKNFDGDPFPIHGDGFQRPWRMQCQGATAQMDLSEGAIGPWRYRASQVFNLSETGLEIVLALTNTGDINLPFGGGFHPWFPRSGDTRLHFMAQDVWMEDHQHFPTTPLRVSDAPDWDFSRACELPKTPINNGYTGWLGVATIEQGAQAVSCTVAASDNLNTAIVYSPGCDADFFCFEPVSHPVDAFHQPGYPGLTALAPGQSMQASMVLSWNLT